jgi:hypothetical protein
MVDITVHVRELRQLFNAIDPSPFGERDLDPAAEEFIVGWAAEVPSGTPLRLVIHVDAASDSAEMDARVRRSIGNFFAGRAAVTRRRLGALFRRGRLSLLIGLAFMAVALTLAGLLGRPAAANRAVEVLRESLIVAGWVAMWRPLEIFLYDWWPIRAEARRFDRLAEMPVEIRHRSDS